MSRPPAVVPEYPRHRERGPTRTVERDAARLLPGPRRVIIGLLDQAVIAAANAANTVFALALLDRRRAGIMLLSQGLGYLVLGVNRALVGEVLLTLASRCAGQRQRRLVSDGVSAAAGFAVVAALVLAVVWLVWPAAGGVDLRDLIWVAPFLPSLLVHDTGRYGYLADRRPQRALVIDAVWAGTQTLAVGALWATDSVSAPGLFACWGVGATAGAGAFLARSRRRPWGGSPRRWFAETRHLSSWFTATALVGQFQTQAVGFLVVNQLSARELSGLRAAQTALLQPAQNVITAVMGVVVPRASRLAADESRSGPSPDRGAGPAAAGLHRQTRTLALGLAVLGAATVAVVVPLARTVLGQLPKFADLGPLVLPIAIQPAIYLVQLPFAAAIRGMQRARLLCVQYLSFTSTSLTGLVVGARLAGLAGAAWGLTTGSAVGLVAMIGLYWHAQCHPAGPEPAGG
ncbi:MAG: oligosaccharide flippase family protein [Dactylosporangium sp.]|nr:oligosaccharide flippase family protein [Dactylosporangium sp.]NNJ60102.1 oligosaccharide flippase family protein [Dactylosporangium sp.]